MTKNRTPSEVGDSDGYNRLQVRRCVRARGDPFAKTPLGGAKRRLRVLIVDDHRAAADTLSMLVHAWGYDVRRAYDGAAGLALVSTYRPDVVLLDMLMPNMSGSQLALQLRQQARMQDCFLIAITGCTDDKRRLHGLEAGVDLFLIKPVSPPILQSLLMAEAEKLTRSRRTAKTHNVAGTTVEQWTGVGANSRARLARDVATATVAI